MWPSGETAVVSEKLDDATQLVQLQFFFFAILPITRSNVCWNRYPFRDNCGSGNEACAYVSVSTMTEIYVTQSDFCVSAYTQL